MKKCIPIILVVMCALALGLTACGSSSASTSGTATSSSSSSTSSSSSSQSKAEADYYRACALFDEGKYYSARAAFEESGYKDWEQRAAACVQPMPETGELFHAPDMVSNNMKLNFTMNEENAERGCYILVFTKDNVLAETVFIKGSGTVETWLPGGEYHVKDSSGAEWYGESEQFGPNGHYETMIFDEVEGDRYLTVLEDGYQYDITINASTNGGQTVQSEDTGWQNRATA